MPCKTQILLFSQLLLGCSLTFMSIDRATASELPLVSTKVSLSDLILDRSPSTPTQIAQGSSEKTQPKNFDFGLGIGFGNSTSFGIDAKIGVAENFSLRPSVYFGSQPGVENKVIPANDPTNSSGAEIKAGRVTNSNTGTSFGIAATYDFKIEPDGKTSVYIGPKIAFTSAAGPVTVDGAKRSNTPNNIFDFSETKIGLIIGADMAVTNDLAIGVNAAYNFSRSISTSGSGLQGFPTGGSLFQPAGTSLDFGIRAAYRF
jgi:opacity protein-like surface antigen